MMAIEMARRWEFNECLYPVYLLRIIHLKTVCFPWRTLYVNDKLDGIRGQNIIWLEWLKKTMKAVHFNSSPDEIRSGCISLSSQFPNWPYFLHKLSFSLGLFPLTAISFVSTVYNIFKFLICHGDCPYCNILGSD
jgi:hypothetical protein